MKKLRNGLNKIKRNKMEEEMEKLKDFDTWKEWKNKN
jgi:hypothetical protein